MDKSPFLSKTFLQVFLSVSGILMFLTAAFVSGYYYRDSQNKLPELKIVEEAYQILINHSYLEAPDPKRLEYAMIHGLVGAYQDENTYFREPAEHELATYTLEGSYGEIGTEILKDEAGYWNLFPFPGSPAEQAGILKMDRLLSVGELIVTTDTRLDLINAEIFGPVDQNVRISIARPPEYAQKEFWVARDLVTIPSVSYRIDPDEPRLGILQLHLIGAHTVDEISQAVESLHSEGVSHFVMDIRHNPGGYLSAGVDIASLFLTDGDILVQQYRNQAPEIKQVTDLGTFTDFPLAILIGENTASAAELIAGALQINQRATLFGQNSYGKDTIQQIFVLSDQSSLRLTAARWWIPGLENTFSEQGLIPDIPTPEYEDLNQPDPAILAVKQYFFP